MFTTASSARDSVARSADTKTSKTSGSGRTALKLKAIDGDAVNRFSNQDSGSKGESGTNLAGLSKSGNLVQMLRSHSIQTKLSMSKPGDRSEREADQVAEKAMAKPAVFEPKFTDLEEGKKIRPQEDEPVRAQEEEQVQAQEEEPVQAQEEQVQAQEEQVQAQEEQVQAQEEEPVQAQEEEPVQAQEDEPVRTREEEEVQAQEEEQVQAQEEEDVQAQDERDVQARTEKKPPPPKPSDARKASSEKAPADFESELASTKSGGEKLPETAKGDMESRFGRDFSDVRIHTDFRASAMNKSIGAQAFAYGSHIYFKQGKFDADTTPGKRLLAHELTHVVQQGAAKASRIDKKGPDPSVSGQAAGPSAGSDASKKAEPSAGQEASASVKPAQSPAPAGKLAAPAPKTETAPTKTKTEVQAEKTPSPAGATGGGGGAGAVGGAGGSVGPAGAAAPAEAPKVETLPLEGKSDQMFEQFAGASASQVVTSFPALGSALKQGLDQEQKEAAEETPPLEARTEGPAQGPKDKGEAKPAAKAPEISEGVTQGEPPAPKAEPHENAAPKPDNKDKKQVLEKQDEGGLLSWLKSNLSGFLSSISTTDSGLNTRAGAAPTIDATGKADPNRAENQRADGQSDVEGQKEETARHIAENPGKEKIQPVKVEEKSRIQIPKEASATVETQANEDMAHYAARPLPASVREAADAKMAPLLQKSMSKPRGDVAAAAQKREQDKQAAVAKAQADADALNEGARKEQDDIVAKSRGEVAQEQEKGLKEAKEKVEAFNKEADSEQTAVKQSVDDRVLEDEKQASKKLEDAEAEAEQEKQKGEAKAKSKKKELEKDSEDESWWDKAKSAIKSAVSAITDAIDAIFDAVRAAVKFIIEKAKEAAVALIEAGRKWIVEQLDKFGKWLKEKVSKYLSAFPALAEKINAAIDKTVNAAKDAVNAVAKKLKDGVTALADALGKAIDSVLSKFQAGLKAAVQIAGALMTGDFAEAAKIAFMAAMEIAGINPKPVMDFINRAGETISMIFKDPVAFFMNVVNGVKKGVQQFQKNIKKHLIGGLIGWLTGALSEVAITLPDKFDLKGIFSLVMQILGLTWQNIRAKIVKKLGPNGEKIVSTIEKTVTFVKDLVTKGPIALWEKVKESLSNLKETVIGGIRDWVVVTVIKEGIIWLLSLLNPASAIVKALKLLFDLVMFFVERWQQIVDFAKSVFDSVGELARGAIAKAANAVESAMAKSVPVIISLLASLIGLGGIGKAVKKIIQKIRKPVDKALDKIIGWLVKKGKALFAKGKAAVKKGVAKGKAAVKKLFEWWKFKEKFKSKDGKSHTFSIKGGKSNPKIMVESTPKEYQKFLDDAEAKLNETQAKKGQRDDTVVKLINQARSQYTAIKTEIDRQKRAKKADDADKAAIDKLLAKLRDLAASTKVLIKNLMLEDGSTDIPVSAAPGYGGTTGGFGKSMTVTPLTLKGKAGSPPNPSVMGENWKHLNLRREGSSSYYVLGHLLNDNLHGPGNEPENLTPLSRSGNAQHSKTVEEKVKAAVFKGGVVRYEVTANYKTWRSESLKGNLDQESDEKAREKKKKIVMAEKYVPDSLTCTAYNVHPATGAELKGDDLKALPKEKQVADIRNKDVPNPIDAGALSLYQLEGSEKVEYELKSVDLRYPYQSGIKKNNRRKETAMKALLQLGGVGKNVAENIYENRTSLKSWSDVANVPQVGEKTKEKLQHQDVPVTVATGQTIWDPPLPKD